jgi:hypothetical protein
MTPSLLNFALKYIIRNAEEKPKVIGTRWDTSTSDLHCDGSLSEHMNAINENRSLKGPGKVCLQVNIEKTTCPYGKVYF